jgi:hypothetical protein
VPPIPSVAASTATGNLKNMPEPGGSTTQSGIYYQNSVTAIYLGRLLQSRAGERSILTVRAEAPEHVDDTVVTYDDGGRDFVQAKERVPTGKPWTKLWTDLREQRGEPFFDRRHDRLFLLVGDVSTEAGVLREMAKRAEGAVSASAWLDAMNEDQRATLLTIERAVSGSTPEEWFQVFAVLTTDVRSSDGLEADRVPLDIPQSTKRQTELFRLLRDRVGGNARYKITFDRATLLASLQRDDPGFELFGAVDEVALRTASTAAGERLRAHKGTFGSTTEHVVRPVVQDIVRWVSSPESAGRVGMLLGDAGRGKTVVLRDVLGALASAGVTAMGVKADVQLSGITYPEDIQKRLQLPESIQRVLTVLTNDGGPVVLLVDQIDALSHNLAQDALTLDLVLDAVLRAVSLRNVRVVLSCRTFDAASDPRVRRLDVKKEFRLEELADDEVKSVLTAASVSYEELTTATRALLRTPLHLDVFLWVKDRGGTPHRNAPVVLQDLYASLMTDVVLVNDPAAPTAADREHALLSLADVMANDQRTTVPLTNLRQDVRLDRALRWLASHGVVTISADRATFLHQTFFDYLYARRFVDRGESLVIHVLNGPQALRQRTELVQILTYARGTEPTKYVEWLDELFRTPTLRPHLHRLLVRWLGRVPNPLPSEIAWVDARLHDSATRAEVLEGLHGNGAWIPALFPVFTEMLQSGESTTVDAVLTYLGTVVEESQEIITPYLKIYVDAGKEERQRALWILNRIRSWREPAAVELFEQIITYDEIELGHFFDFRDMARIHPGSFARIVRTLLERATTAAYKKGSTGSVSFSLAFDGFAQTDFGDALRDLSAADPSVYLDAILPWFLDVVHDTSGTTDARWFQHDAFGYAWRSGFDRTTTRITQGIVQALITEAEIDDAQFRARFATLTASDAASAQMVAASVLATLPERADEAIAFLVGDPRRLSLGDLHERTRTLIANAVRRASDAAVADLEAAILAYHEPYPPRTVADLRSDGKYQYLLLAAFPRTRLSAAGRRRLDELQRKLPKFDTRILPARELVTVRSEHPPIKPDRAARMSDDDWLRAMAKYRHTNDPMTASPRQLAESLKTAAKGEPQRFAALFDRLPDDTAQVYVGALVHALGEDRGSLSPQILENVRRFARNAESDLCRPIAWMLQNHPEDVDDAILEILEQWVKDPSLDHPHYATSLDYLNADRGAAFLAAMYALRVRDTAKSRERRWTLMEHAISDGAPFLRAAAIEELRYELFAEDATPASASFYVLLWRRAVDWLTRGADRRHARRAMDAFRACVNGAFEVRGAFYADDFLRLALAKEGTRALGEVASMLRSDDEAVRERGATLVAMAAVSPKALRWWNIGRARLMVRSLLQRGDVKQRGAVATVFAHHFDGPAASYAIKGLRKLLCDPSSDVRTPISIVIRETPEKLVRERTFLRAYAASVAITGAQFEFGDFLLDHLATNPTFGLDLVEAALPHLQGAQFPHGDDIVRYVLRVASSQRLEPALLSRAMDVFDAVDAQFGRYTASLLSEWDRP